MTKLRKRSALAVVTGALLFVPACHHEKETGPQYIMLTFNGGACEQNGLSDVIEIHQGRSVVYQGASLVSQFEVRLNACPFTECPVSSPHGTSVNVGQPKADAVGTTFNYTAMSVNGDPCRNPSSMGVRILPGP
ncbi:MAG TPA: hypothetical protein VKB58_18555 [Terriglobales bacterium]|jgi:hypothetical protein|nr:hypothetical protein [Terriglobales bacterium]